jgi:hypothetical protein
MLSGEGSGFDSQFLHSITQHQFCDESFALVPRLFFCFLVFGRPSIRGTWQCRADLSSSWTISCLLSAAERLHQGRNVGFRRYGCKIWCQRDDINSQEACPPGSNVDNDDETPIKKEEQQGKGKAKDVVGSRGGGLATPFLVILSSSRWYLMRSPNSRMLPSTDRSTLNSRCRPDPWPSVYCFGCRKVCHHSLCQGRPALGSAGSFRRLVFLPSVWCGRVGRQETSMALTIVILKYFFFSSSQ